MWLARSAIPRPPAPSSMSEPTRTPRRASRRPPPATPAPGGAGSFSYTPASGTKLDVGANQNLKADFTPTDTGNYNTASKTVQINVKKANQTINFGALAGTRYGGATSTT